ncbi:DeoR/GlpR family DNA-binding transcription regulator [Sedimentitalea nanhaiensis]|uniref:Transcriptional regulator, DeoR family n=1 Tax=Sedimentitalea nanhaiensis TaxID=999627 RepID=A0A1I7D2J2_9RHOB|nr:DeoR/GlpR family DNA-binding transcription regulator [Sedimentitalea nanhaiensis]SFU05883.1 transcriptional regulator, DeoR family [Sedimentitalea nanhaiensis]
MKQRSAQSHRTIQLLDALRRFGGSARNAELARAMDVSEETVRRTIKTLSKSGDVTRVHGGAYLSGTQDQPSFFRRIGEHTREKRAIAAAVATRVADGSSLFLDVGSTTAFVAEELRSRRDLLVVTNSIGVAQTLANHHGNRVYLLGGEMHSDERGAFGTVTENQARRFALDLTILSADAVNAARGILFINPGEASLSMVTADCAERVLVALDHFKFNASAPHCGPDPRNIDDIVTDRMPSGALAQALHDWGVTLRLTDGTTQNATD